MDVQLTVFAADKAEEKRKRHAETRLALHRPRPRCVRSGSPTRAEGGATNEKLETSPHEQRTVDGAIRTRGRSARLGRKLKGTS